MYTLMGIEILSFSVENGPRITDIELRGFAPIGVLE
jgi:hypothetical protein